MSGSEKETEGQTFKNENITVTVHRKPGCQVKFDIFVQLAAMKAAYAAAIKNIRKEVSVPGFRKGKAPENWILEKYKSTIEKESIDIAINTALTEAIQLTQIHPMKNSFKRPHLNNFKPNAEGSFSIEFESHPTVPNINPSDIKLKNIHPEPVSDEKIQDQIAYIQQEMATYEPVTNRGIMRGDYAKVNIDMISPQPRMVASEQQIHVADKDLPPWVIESIIGLKAGESSESNDPAKDENRFRTTVVEVLKGNLPEINEEFAKKCKAESLDDLKQKVTKQLEGIAKDQADSAMIKQVEDRLLDLYTFEIPASTIKQDAEARLQNYLNDIRAEGVEESWIKENLDKMKSEMEQISERAIRLLLIMHHVVNENKLTLTDEERMNEERLQLMSAMRGVRNVDWNAPEQERHQQISELAMKRKVRRYLLDNATIE